jgi:RES domain-containing protein
MLPVRHQFTPFSGEGARLYGGRWNPPGVPALYLATDHASAVAEFYQGLAKPGTLAPYQIDARRIADLTDGKGWPADAAIEHSLSVDWKAMAAGGKAEPPTWLIVADLLAAGAEGALVPSVQNRGGTNLVLWRWHDAAAGPGEGAALSQLDAEEALKVRRPD